MPAWLPNRPNASENYWLYLAYPYTKNYDFADCPSAEGNFGADVPTRSDRPDRNGELGIGHVHDQLGWGFSVAEAKVDTAPPEEPPPNPKAPTVFTRSVRAPVAARSPKRAAALCISARRKQTPRPSNFLDRSDFGTKPGW